MFMFAAPEDLIGAFVGGGEHDIFDDILSYSNQSYFANGSKYSHMRPASFLKTLVLMVHANITVWFPLLTEYVVS